MPYRFEYCGRFRALCLPYFLRSTSRESRVIKPAFFNTGRNPGLTWRSARVIPCRIAEAWALFPPPWTLPRHHTVLESVSFQKVAEQSSVRFPDQNTRPATCDSPSGFLLQRIYGLVPLHSFFYQFPNIPFSVQPCALLSQRKLHGLLSRMWMIRPRVDFHLLG
jgi:hypothetical protein